MIAYVRFRQSRESSNAPDFIADYAPEHDVLEWAAEHFAERMGKSSWLIATPDAVAMSDGLALSILTKPIPLPSPFVVHAIPHASAQPALRDAVAESIADAADMPGGQGDAESLWLIYYRSIFNPARVNQRGMEQHMPVRYWRGLPEAALIPEMLSAAHTGERKVAQAHMVGAMRGRTVLIDAAQAQPRRDPASTLDTCRRCELWKAATQVVPGCGPTTARIMLIGEQPGDQEDLAGRPFIGPAGKLLDSAMLEAGLSREHVYLTNAVKHFKWTRSGKRRLHKTPQQREIEACRVWLEDEIAAVRPEIIVTLGASALNSLFHAGRYPSDGKRGETRPALLGQPASETVPPMYGESVVLSTRHPSYALRQSDPSARRAIFDEIVDTLRAAVQRCAKTA